MKGQTETLMKLNGFVDWRWEDEFRKAVATYKPNADDAAVERMRLFIVTDFVEFLLEVVNEELRLGLYVDVEGLSEEGIVGTVDFEDRRRDLAAVERRIAAWGRVPRICRTGPILDRLLACTEFVKVPDRLEFGEFKRECLARFKHDGSIAHCVQAANADGTYNSPFKAAPINTARTQSGSPENEDMPSLDDLTFD